MHWEGATQRACAPSPPICCSASTHLRPSSASSASLSASYPQIEHHRSTTTRKKGTLAEWSKAPCSGIARTVSSSPLRGLEIGEGSNPSGVIFCYSDAGRPSFFCTSSPRVSPRNRDILLEKNCIAHHQSLCYTISRTVLSEQRRILKLAHHVMNHASSTQKGVKEEK